LVGSRVKCNLGGKKNLKDSVLVNEGRVLGVDVFGPDAGAQEGRKRNHPDHQEGTGGWGQPLMSRIWGKKELQFPTVKVGVESPGLLHKIGKEGKNPEGTQILGTRKKKKKEKKGHRSDFHG